MKWLRRLAIVIGALLGIVLLAVVALVALVALNGGRGTSPLPTEIVGPARPATADSAAAARQREGRARVGRADAPQILFGDLHVHTHYSADAALQALGITDREGPSPPGDACDFARFCSQLDFWSINDHAESLTQTHWQRTIDTVRECNALSGDPANPDLVTYLGWEWSHASSPEVHYGHKNVVLRDIAEGRVPARPIGSAAGPHLGFMVVGAIGTVSKHGLDDWADFHRWMRDQVALADCPEGVPVRELPEDCRESAPDPPTLFAKLADWGFPAVVIPHGLSWGITNPAHADLAVQLGMHDPRWQPLLEVYSGHGNSEVYRDFVRGRETSEGEFVCPRGQEGVELCCERAEVLARERCPDPQSAHCDAAVLDAQRAATGFLAEIGTPVAAVPGTTNDDWGECGQIQDAFLPAYNYRPRQSAQYALALGNDEGDTTDQRFRWGLIGASDTHRSRPGTGYREFARQLMTDGAPYPIPGADLEDRGASFYYTGGLAAVHAGARDRDSIFDALANRHVYATSGDRTLLWFDLIADDGTKYPMGSEVAANGTPRFEVRALGAFEQQPGCPTFVQDALPAERIQDLCRGHCYHPSDARKAIERIEVVRIRPQDSAEEAIRPLIEDPWRTHECPGDGSGCRYAFEDPDFLRDGRESVYYVRAIQAPSPAVNGDPLRCTRDAEGRCIAVKGCGTLPDGTPDDCLAPVGERAWSSPIFVDPPSSPGA